MAINPDIEEAFILRGWYDSSGAEQAFQSHTSGMVGGSSVQFNRNELMSIEEVKNAKLGENAEKPETFCTRGTIMHIKPDNLWYPACPGRAGQSCNKKVVEDSEGWRCEKCDIVHEKPEYRWATFDVPESLSWLTFI
jgi:replication factor A1